MHIFITGGTGMIGSALVQALEQEKHQLTILSRQPHPNTQRVTFVQNFAKFEHLNAFDAIINLAGEPIFDKRWTATQKEKLRQSRLTVTEKLVKLIQQSEQPPRIFLSGSATGFYGDLPDFAEKGEEETACHHSFSAQLCHEWEKTAWQAQSEKTRVCLLRTGMVFDPKGGALKRMLPLYRLGLAGKLGSGKQHWAWISLEDHIRAMLFLLKHPQAQGAFNFVAPTPISNAEFNRMLAQALHRPAFFRVPAFALKGIFGERAQLLLDNQPLRPQKLIALGFQFQHSTFSQWLHR